MSVIVKVSGLTKDFGSQIKAVDGLSFNVPAGQVYGFLGQNGAGKSTTIRMLLTLIRPDAGSIEIFGKDLVTHRSEILQQVGAIIEKPDMYKYLTALENLSIFAKMSGVRLSGRQLLDQLNVVGLAERAHSKVKTYSQGMKQRLGIAIALVHDPQLVILDEPTNGLDPQGIADVRNLVRHLSRDRRKTLLVSSHLLSEMELIADSMLIIDKGKKVVEGKTAELLRPDKIQVELVTDDKTSTIEKIRGSQWGVTLVDSPNGTVVMAMEQASIPAFNKWLVENQVNVFSLKPKHSLEDFFLSVTGS